MFKTIIKIFIIISTLFLCVSALGQNTSKSTFGIQNGETISVQTYGSLDFALDEFITYGIMYGVDLNNFKDLKGVYLADFQNFLEKFGSEPRGITQKLKDGSFNVGVNIREGPFTTIRLILFHEFTHLLLWDIQEGIHCNETKCPELTKDGLIANEQLILQDWEFHVMKLFIYIRQQQIESKVKN